MMDVSEGVRNGTMLGVVLNVTGGDDQVADSAFSNIDNTGRGMRRDVIPCQQ